MPGLTLRGGSAGPPGPPTRRPEELARRLLRRSPAWGLLLDHDGTLARLRLDPARALPSRRTRLLLARLLRAGHRICIVSGRPLRFLRAAYPLVGIDLAGSHGAELALADGARVRFKPPTAAFVRLAERLRRELRPRPSGLRIERKPFGLAVHVRAVEPSRRAGWLDLGRESLRRHLPRGFGLLEGSWVVEARPKGVGKAAVPAALAHHSARWRNLPRLAVGDDNTDEELFGTLGPRDVSVLVAFRPRVSAAQARLRGTGEVQRLLDGLGSSSRGGSACSHS